MRSDPDGLFHQQACPECKVPALRPCENADGRPFAQLVHTQRANVPADQVEAWKRAVSAHNAAKRNQRIKRPEPPTAGYRRPS